MGKIRERVGRVGGLTVRGQASSAEQRGEAMKEGWERREGKIRRSEAAGRKKRREPEGAVIGA